MEGPTVQEFNGVFVPLPGPREFTAPLGGKACSRDWFCHRALCNKVCNVVGCDNCLFTKGKDNNIIDDRLFEKWFAWKMEQAKKRTLKIVSFKGMVVPVLSSFEFSKKPTQISCCLDCQFYFHANKEQLPPQCLSCIFHPRNINEYYDKWLPKNNRPVRYIKRKPKKCKQCQKKGEQKCLW